MRKILCICSLLFALAIPVTLSTGCRSASGKAHASEQQIIGDLKAALAVWFDGVVAGTITSAQEDEMRVRWAKYLSAQSALKILVLSDRPDASAVTEAMAGVKVAASDVLTYIHAVTGH